MPEVPGRDRARRRGTRVERISKYVLERVALYHNGRDLVFTGIFRRNTTTNYPKLL